MHLKEQPLGYWEKKSYMMVLPKTNHDKWSVDFITSQISQMGNVSILKSKFDKKTNILYFDLAYDNEVYQVGIYPSNYHLSEFYFEKSFRFSDEEKEALKKVEVALTIFMEFKDDAKKSFHFQLKLACQIVPNMIGLVDDSAERLIPQKWVWLAAHSKVTPAPTDMFHIHAVYNEQGEVWLHTHGLCRCGLTELEILKSDKEHCDSHCHLINSLASYMIDQRGNYDPRKKSAYLGILSDHTPIVAFCQSWTKALKQYDFLSVGGIQDRKDGHHSKTSPIFLYRSKEDEKKNRLSKVSDFNCLWGGNELFFFTDEETERMKQLAMERFDYVKKAMKDSENHVIVKIGLPVDDQSGLEHIWFELLEFQGEKFKAKLTQEPYQVSHIHSGDERWFTLEDVTDWRIYTPQFEVDPGSVYLLY